MHKIEFTLVAMFYIPCISTIAALVKEFGLKKALSITLFEIVFQLDAPSILLGILILIVGGVVYRALKLSS